MKNRVLRIRAVGWFMASVLMCHASYGMMTDSNSTKLSGYGFIENRGQVERSETFSERVLYYFQTEQFAMYFTENGLSYCYLKATPKEDATPQPSADQRKHPGGEAKTAMTWERAWIDVELVGKNRNALLYGREQRSDLLHFYTAGVTDIRHYDELVFEDVYPGIDWIIKLNGDQLKHDFLVDAGADPTQIQMRFSGADTITLESGGYKASCALGAVTENAPVGFQGGEKVAVDFTLCGDTLGFLIGAYDDDQALLIDPEITWSTYFGGPINDAPYAVVVDTDGNVYMAGRTSSPSNIAFNGHQNTMNNNQEAYSDAMLIKFNSEGDRLWSTYYGGTHDDEGHAVAVDAEGNVYMAGRTQSNFGGISTTGAHQVSMGGFYDAFLVKFDSNGTRLWGTYFGGNGRDEAYGCAVDSENNVYISGHTDSFNNISQAGHQMTLSGEAWKGFLAKFSPDGIRIWGTYYGQSPNDSPGSGCAVDTDNNVFLSGHTYSSEGIAFNGYQNTISSFYADAYLVKFSSTGTRLWGTYFGGSLEEYATGCATDLQGNVFMTGITSSTNGIAHNAHQNTFGGPLGSEYNGDAFLVKFDSDGNRDWSTYYGGIQEDEGLTCSTDDAGYVYLAGTTKSPDNMASSGALMENHGNPGPGINDRDVFLARFSPTGERQWGTYFGTANDEYGGYCHAGAGGVVYLALRSNSASGLAVDGFQNTGAGQSDAVLAKLNGCGSFSSTSLVSCGPYTWPLSGETYDVSGLYYTVLSSGAGCDSTIALQLDIAAASGSTVHASACESYTWAENEATYTSSGLYVVTYTNAAGCDSTVTLQLDILEPSIAALQASACDSFFWHQTNTTYTASGIYEDLVLNQAGCDSLISLQLTITSSTTSTQSAEACTSYFWEVAGASHTISGSYTHILTNADGCDSTITLQLQINEADHISQSLIVCDSLYWDSSAQWLYASGNYSSPFVNQAGCDSILTLQLTVNESTYIESSASVCTSYFWALSGNEYSQSGLYEAETVNEAGCPGYALLDLEILDTYSVYEEASACDTYFWGVTGDSYSQSGLYSATLQAFNGCDSTLSILLSIANTDYITETITDCRPYVWPVSGETYTESGTYIAQFINEGACDSVHQLMYLYEPIAIVHHPQDVVGLRGGSATFIVESDESTDTFQWQMLEEGEYVDLQESDRYTGTTSASLQVGPLTWSDGEAVFRCVVSRGHCHSNTFSANLQVVTAAPLLYPNPSDGRFTLAVPEAYLDTEVRIYDDQGKLIIIRLLPALLNPFDLRSLAPGVYQMTLAAEARLRFVIVK